MTHTLEQPEVSPTKLLRLKEAAKILGISVRTLYRIIADGHLTRVHVRGCSCIPSSQLNAYLQRLERGQS